MCHYKKKWVARIDREPSSPVGKINISIWREKRERASDGGTDRWWWEGMDEWQDNIISNRISLINGLKVLFLYSGWPLTFTYRAFSLAGVISSSKWRHSRGLLPGRQIHGRWLEEWLRKDTVCNSKWRQHWWVKLKRGGTRHTHTELPKPVRSMTSWDNSISCIEEVSISCYTICIMLLLCIKRGRTELLLQLFGS